MSENLSDFLVDLAADPAQMAAFLADPERTFDAAQLTAGERAAIRSRDARRLAAALTDGAQMQNGNVTNDMPMIKRAPPRRKKPSGPKKKKGGRKKKGGTKKSGGSRKGARKGSRKGSRKSGSTRR